VSDRQVLRAILRKATRRYASGLTPSDAYVKRDVHRTGVRNGPLLRRLLGSK
jgi:hypothetical protein